LKLWGVKALLVFCAAAACEIGQFFGFYFLGKTFDPLDIFMYAFVVCFAAFVEIRIFPRLFKFWKSEQV